jgi:hypothetical protein
VGWRKAQLVDQFMDGRPHGRQHYRPRSTLRRVLRSWFWGQLIVHAPARAVRGAWNWFWGQLVCAGYVVMFVPSFTSTIDRT